MYESRENLLKKKCWRLRIKFFQTKAEQKTATNGYNQYRVRCGKRTELSFSSEATGSTNQATRSSLSLIFNYFKNKIK